MEATDTFEADSETRRLHATLKTTPDAKAEATADAGQSQRTIEVTTQKPKLASDSSR